MWSNPSLMRFNPGALVGNSGRKKFSSYWLGQAARMWTWGKGREYDRPQCQETEGNQVLVTLLDTPMPEPRTLLRFVVTWAKTVTFFFFFCLSHFELSLATKSFLIDSKALILRMREWKPRVGKWLFHVIWQQEAPWSPSSPILTIYGWGNWCPEWDGTSYVYTTHTHTHTEQCELSYCSAEKLCLSSNISYILLHVRE